MEAKPADLLLCDSLILWVSGAGRGALIPVHHAAPPPSSLPAGGASLLPPRGPPEEEAAAAGLPQERPPPAQRGFSCRTRGARRRAASRLRGHGEDRREGTCWARAVAAVTGRRSQARGGGRRPRRSAPVSSAAAGGGPLRLGG